MISSTVRDLAEQREQVNRFLGRVGLETIWMDGQPAGSGNAYRRSMDLVDNADHFVCILGERYGSIDADSGLSYTHLELLRAQERGLEPIVFMSDPGGRLTSLRDDDADSQLEQMRQWCEGLWGVNYFASVADLHGMVLEALWSRVNRGGTATPSPPLEITPPKPPAPYVVQPYTLLSAGLVGRVGELRALSRWLDEGTTPILQVEALGGVGKTALLWHWFQTLPSLDVGRGRLWWSFYEGDIALDDLVVRALAYFACRSLQDVRQMRAMDREEQLLTLLEGSRHLLVLDGLERATRAYASDEDAFVADAEVAAAPDSLWSLGGTTLNAHALAQTQQLRRTADVRLGSFLRRLATLRGAKTLISTRNPVFDLELSNGQSLPGVGTLRIPGLPEEAARSLWKEVTGRPADGEVLTTLLATDNHPLFIRALASEVAQFRPAPGDYAGWRSAHPEFDPLSVLGADPRKRHVLKFAMSGLDAVEGELLTAIAQASGPVPFNDIAGPRALDAARAYPDHRRRLAEVDLALKSLEDRGLVGWDRVTNRYDLHPLVRGVVRSLTGFRAPATVRSDATISRGSDVGLGKREPAIGIQRLHDGVPAPSRLVDVLRLEQMTPDEILRRWAKNGRSTKAVIGMTAYGPLTVDLRTDGPHGLIAGSTGSGKSELLRTIVASLAVANRPEEMNFLLIDFKGGAAFRDCLELPHTVGLVTNLDPHLADRLVASLYAELRRRQQSFAEMNAVDIDAYAATKKSTDAPMPRLVIVIDEFAALAREVPELMNGLIDIARLGRSLGLHLLLATQRPSGVVSEDIRANVNLRIALRMWDPSDSQDVIDSPHAAELPRSAPGSAYARVGTSELIAFRTSWVGSRPPAPGEDDASTDLKSLVGIIREAAALADVPVSVPLWQPELPSVVTLDEVAKHCPIGRLGAGRLVVPFGLVDLPHEQRRDAAVIELKTCGHLAVISGPRSGRSNTLRTIAAATSLWTSPRDVHILAVDDGSGRLAPLMGLPHVGAVVSAHDQARMRQLPIWLGDIIAHRQRRVADDASDESVPTPIIMVLFDGWDRLTHYDDGRDDGLASSWLHVLQRGASVGIRVVLTGDRTLLYGPMSSLFDEKLVLRMPDTLDYVEIGLPRRSLPRAMGPGRGFLARSRRELQVAILAEGPDEPSNLDAFDGIVESASRTWAEVPRHMLPVQFD